MLIVYLVVFAAEWHGWIAVRHENYSYQLPILLETISTT